MPCRADFAWRSANNSRSSSSISAVNCLDLVGFLLPLPNDGSQPAIFVGGPRTSPAHKFLRTFSRASRMAAI